MRATWWMPLVVVVAILPSTISHLSAQTCFRGRPPPACDRFLITEVGISYRLNGGSAVSPGDSVFFNPQRIYINGDIGLMWNRDGGWALGGSLYGAALVDYAFTVRLGAKARIRKWLTDAVALDLGAGPIVGSVPVGNWAYRTGVGFTTSAELVLGDRVSLINIIEFMPDEHGTDTAWYVGGRLGSWPGAIASGVAAVLLGIGAVATLGY